MDKLKLDGRKEDVRIFISEEAHNKMWQYIKGVSTEIEGLGFAYLSTERDPEETVRRIVVEDLFILEQEVSGAAATIREDAIHTYLADKCRKEDVRPINVWWHSHASMGTFWSGTDTGTADKFMNADWMIHIVGNHRGECKTKLAIYKPYHIEIDDCELFLLKDHITGMEISDEIQKDIDDKVTKKTYAAGYGNGYYSGGQGGYNRQGKKGQWDPYDGYHTPQHDRFGKATNLDNDSEWQQGVLPQGEEEVYNIDNIFIGNKIWAPQPTLDPQSKERLLMRAVVIDVHKDVEQLSVYFPSEVEGSNMNVVSIEDIEVEASIIRTALKYHEEKEVLDEVYSILTKNMKDKNFEAARDKIASMRKIDKWGADRKYNLNEMVEIIFAAEKELENEEKVPKDKGHKKDKKNKHKNK